MSVWDDCNFLKAVLSWMSRDKASLFFFFFFLNKVTEVRLSFQMTKESLCNSTNVWGKESPEKTLEKSCALFDKELSAH